MAQQLDRPQRRRLHGGCTGEPVPCPLLLAPWTLANVCALRQFSLGFFFIIDAAAFSHSARNGSNVHVKFVDWIPGICSALGMLVINSIEKSRLQADSFSYSGNGVAWKARFVLFLGFALLAGGLAGSVVSYLPTYLPTSILVYSVGWLLMGIGVYRRLWSLSIFCRRIRCRRCILGLQT